MASQKDSRTCEVCGKRLHKVQTCRTCGKALCNNHLSRSRHQCQATEESTLIPESEGISSGTTPRQIPQKLIIVIAVVVIVAVSAAVILLGGNGSPGGGGNDEKGEITEVIPGASFSIELSMARITEYLTESKDLGGGIPGKGVPGGGKPFGNGTIPAKNRGFGFKGGISEFLVAVPESLTVEDPTSASVEIRVIGESQGGYNIYGVNITTLSIETYDPANPPSVDLNLTAPSSTGTYDIYVTTLTFSGLDTSSTFRRVIGEYYIGDLVFLIKEEVEVA